MRKFFSDLPWSKKVLLLSLCMTILVVFSTVGISIGLQKKQMKDQLTDQVVGLSALWSSTIASQDIEKVIGSNDVNDPVHKKLTHQLSLIHDMSSPLLHGVVLLPEVDHKEVFILVAPRSYEQFGINSFGHYEAPEEYLEAIAKVSYSESQSFSDIYSNQNGEWITAFSPIKDEDGKVVGILAVDVDASAIHTFQMEIAYYLIIIYLGITIILYFFFKKGFNRVIKPVNELIGEMDHIKQKSKIIKELQRAEKMNAIGQIAASVAHEIRNPMTVVKGFLQIFLAKKELSNEEHTYIKLMIDEMNRAETIISDYLSLAKPDLEHIETVNAGELANKAVDLMNSYAMMAKNIEMKNEIEEGVLVRGIRSELQQVLINILKNGIEAMKEGGVLSVKVYKKNKFGVFEIGDTGIGMTSEELERLGTAFYSLKETGTGMGLMVSYQIVERLKGTIEVESQKGKGTIFKISVPLES